MKYVCHCYDGVARDINFKSAPIQQPENPVKYYGCLDDIKICSISRNSDGWYYILLGNKFTDDRRIPESVYSGFGFTSRKLCFDFVIKLIQVHKVDHRSKITLNPFIETPRFKDTVEKLKNLVDSQQSLGSEFSKILEENLWDLYEA